MASDNEKPVAKSHRHTTTVEAVNLTSRPLITYQQLKDRARAGELEQSPARSMAPPHLPIMPSSKRRLDEAFPRQQSPELGQDTLLPAAQVAKTDDGAGEVAKIANRLINNLEKDVKKEKRTKELAIAQVKDLNGEVGYLKSVLECQGDGITDLEKRISALEKQSRDDEKTIADAYNLVKKVLKPQEATNHLDGLQEDEGISTVLKNVDGLIHIAVEKAEQHEALAWQVYRCLKNGIRHPRD